MGKNKLDKLNADFAVGLRNSGIKSFEAGHYLESSIIAFQLLEVYLRMTIEGLAMASGINEKVINEISYNEQSVAKLITYLDMLYPNNHLSERLRDLNTKRNQIMHNLLFTFKSEDQLKGELKKFYRSAVQLHQNFSSLLDSAEIVKEKGGD